MFENAAILQKIQAVGSETLTSLDQLSCLGMQNYSPRNAERFPVDTQTIRRTRLIRT